MGASNDSVQPLSTRQKVAGAIQSSGVSISIDQLGTLVDYIVEAIEPSVKVAEVTADASPETPAEGAAV